MGGSGRGGTGDFALCFILLGPIGLVSYIVHSFNDLIAAPTTCIK